MSDARALARIDYDTWVPRRRRPVLESAAVSFFDRSHGGTVEHVLVASSAQTLVGFVVSASRRDTSMRDTFEKASEEVTAIAVDQFWRRRRVATALLLAAATEAHRRGQERLVVSIPRHHPAMQGVLLATGFDRDRRLEIDQQMVVEETQWGLVTSRAQAVGNERLRA